MELEQEGHATWENEGGGLGRKLIAPSKRVTGEFMMALLTRVWPQLSWENPNLQCAGAVLDSQGPGVGEAGPLPTAERQSSPAPGEQKQGFRMLSDNSPPSVLRIRACKPPLSSHVLQLSQQPGRQSSGKIIHHSHFIDGEREVQ